MVAELSWSYYLGVVSCVVGGMMMFYEREFVGTACENDNDCDVSNEAIGIEDSALLALRGNRP